MLLEDILREKIRNLPVETPTRERNRPVHRIEEFLIGNTTNIIAEIKAKSPSRGFIRELNIGEIVSVYNKYACGISVLTDERFFGGGFDLLADVSSNTGLPVLCKDFIVDESQVRAAYFSGADLVLLIVRVLGMGRLMELYDCIKGFGMEALVEVHTHEELKSVEDLNLPVVGVNSRDLDTLEVDIRRASDIFGAISWDCVRVFESGVRCRRDIEELSSLCDAYLVGEALLTADDIEVKFRELKGYDG